MRTRVLSFDPEAIADAARLIRAGGVVAVPTETVYGLAADATNPEAVAGIYEAKGRPSFNPLIVHVSDLAAAAEIADLDPLSRKLAAAFWPGPLTIVAPLLARSPIATIATAGLTTIALRVPAHPAMRSLLGAVERPLAAPSANASNKLSPTRAEHVVRSLEGRVPLVIDGGSCPVGLESTIVQADGATIRLLRPGPITASALQEAGGVGLVSGSGKAIIAPGQLAQHYAPKKPLRLQATSALPGEWLIGFGTVSGDVSLSRSGNLQEAAARLFDLLHAADLAPSTSIAVAPIPDEGLGTAINDRLSRAASRSA